MAAIDHVGNTIVIAAAGTIDIPHLELRSARILVTASAAELVIVEISTGHHAVIHYQTTKSAPPHSDDLDVWGRYGSLSVNTVTACSAFLQKA